MVAVWCNRAVRSANLCKTVMDDPPTRRDLETKGLDAKEAVEYIRDQLILCLDATDDPDADAEAIQARYTDLAEKLRRAADELDE